MKRLGKVWTALVYIFLYLPMIVLFIGSFNDGKDLSEFEGFTAPAFYVKAESSGFVTAHFCFVSFCIKFSYRSENICVSCRI